MKRHGLVATMISLGAVIGLLVPSAGVGAEMTTYAGAGTMVAKQSGQAPLLDDGGAVCLTEAILPVMGLGGGCVSFPNEGQRPAIHVTDEHLGEGVAFQVCIDNNGDGECYMDPRQPPHPCDDIVAFSHDDGGVFHNPLGFYREPGTGLLKPLPTSIPPQCMSPAPVGPRRPWVGYIVFLCEGVHLTAMPHEHTPTTGTIALSPTIPQPAAGDFCQTIRDSAKTYFLIP